MKSTIARVLVAIPVFCLVVLGSTDVLNNQEVQFIGTVKSIQVNGEGAGTLFLQLDTIELRVIVNPQTILQDGGTDVITMEALSDMKDSAAPGKDLIVEVTGKFSSNGILAGRVRVADPAKDFIVRGHITGIYFLSNEDALISLLGITVRTVSKPGPPTSIQMDGENVPLSALKTGTQIEVSGNILDGTWTADWIKVLSGASKKRLVFFEGKVQEYDKNQIMVAVTGTASNTTTVNLTPETVIRGTLEKNAYVLVIGTISTNYSFTAKEIRVLPALEIKPDERKLAIGESGTFTVKLRESSTSGIPVKLGVDKDSIVGLSTSGVTIPAGGLSADFQAKGLAVGTAIITATMTGGTATAMVTVGQVPDPDAKSPAAGEVRVSFSPDHVKMDLNEVREVVLHIQPPPKADVKVAFDSTDRKVVPIPEARSLGAGAAMLKVLIKSTGETGKASVLARLPEVPGVAAAELVVEVEAKKSK
jgi:hypothetical protein